MSERAWVVAGFAAIVVVVIAWLVRATVTKPDNERTEKVALAAITRFLSLISGGVAGAVASEIAIESAETAGAAAMKATAPASIQAIHAAAEKAATGPVNEVSNNVQPRSNKPWSRGNQETARLAVW